MEYALRINALAKSFGRVAAVDGVTIDVPQRSIFGLIGPNGAGKTTLFSLVCGFLKPDRGTIEVCGGDVIRDGLPPGRVGILPQDALFERNVPILQQLMFFLRLQGVARATARGEVEAVLAKVGLAEMGRRRVGTLSHGMVKRLALAQAFLGHPQLLLLDEPTAGLDPAQTRAICDLIRDLRQHATVVVSSHNLIQLQELCDHVAVLNRGKVVASGPIGDFMRERQRIRLVLSATPAALVLAEIAAAPGVDGFLGESVGGHVLIPRPDGDLDAVLARVLRILLDHGIVPRQILPAVNLESAVLSLLQQDDTTAKSPTRSSRVAPPGPA